MTLSEDDFNRQCIEFVLRSEQYGDRSWSLSSKCPGGPLERLKLATGPDHSPSSGGRLIGGKVVLIKNEMRKRNDSDEICTYEYHVIYSESYEVPVMYFSVSDQRGAPKLIDELLLVTEQRDLSMIVNQVEHPLLFTPFYMVHPCRTQDFMELIFGPWNLPLATAQTSGQTTIYRNTIENAAQFVQTLDHLQHRSSSLFDAPNHEPDETSSADIGVGETIHERRRQNQQQLNVVSDYLGTPQNELYERPIDDGYDRNVHNNGNNNDDEGDDEGNDSDNEIEPAREHYPSRDRSTWMASEPMELSRGSVDDVCHQYRGAERIKNLSKIYLRHCSRYNMADLSSRAIFDLIAHNDSLICEQTLSEFLQLDETIGQFDSLFTTLLRRYNCHNGYSVKWNCDDCKTAYKDWLCATHLPFYMKTVRVKPCISFCERVEQRCPYLHPITREQYGGQPVFICRDPNIPFVPEITPDIPYSDPGNCYDLCHLSENLTELVIDSLSKYDHTKCPKESAIAGNVESSCRGAECAKIGPNGPAEPNQTANQPDLDKHQLLGHHRQAPLVQPHKKKLDELREVLANYKNQAKTHRYHAEHSSIDHHSESPGETGQHSSR